MFAARITDMHICPLQTPPIPIPHVGGPIVQPIMGKPCLIGGLPAAGAGSLCTCVGPPDSIIATSNVLVNNTPLAKMGDTTAHGGTIIIGCTTVVVGAGAMNPSAIAAKATEAAQAAADVAAQADAVMQEVQAANEEMNALLEEGNLSEAQQERLNELQGDYGDTINDMGLNN
nr:PAAR domain-containing protein [Portibacter marinus]